MSASQFPAAPPRASLTPAAIVLTCCLAVYVIVVPLLLHSGSAGWLLILATALAVIASVTVLAALWQSRQALADAREELARRSSQANQVIQNAERHATAQAEQARQQAAEAAALQDRVALLKAELTSLEGKVSAASAREQQARAEAAELREGIEKRLEEQSRQVNDAVRHALEERLPPAIRGKTPPAGLTGIDSELSGYLDQAVDFAIAAADAQQSIRTAVVAMSRRVQASAHRIQEEAALMADRHPGNADVLEVSMRVDHAAAQQARTAQSTAVLLGEWPGQQWPDPLPLVDVVRAASGRIIAYRRIEVAGDQEIAAAAPAVEPLIHLVAELLANATQSSPPTTQVPVTVRAVQRGAVIEVHDCGVGLDDYRLEQARAIATGERPVGLQDLGEFPQTGLAVVGQYARRHGFRVDISESVYGGVRAIVGVPVELTESVVNTGPLPVTVPSPPAPVPDTAPASAAAPASAPAGPAAGETASAAGETAPAAGDAPAASLASAGTAAQADAGSGPADSGSSGTTTPDGPSFTRRSKLPRRVSPRRDAGPEPRPARNTGPMEIVQQPTPEEAGAWMGAFLTSPGDQGGVQPGDPGVLPSREPQQDAEVSWGDRYSTAFEENSDTSEENSTGQQEQ